MPIIDHMDMNKAVAKAINAERGAAGMTIKELSAKTQISERTLIRLLNSERDIRVNQLASFARVFHISPMKLIEEAEEYQEREKRQQKIAQEADQEAKLQSLLESHVNDPDYKLAAYQPSKEQLKRDILGGAFNQEEDNGEV